jgi:hypothetical protein
MKRRRARMIPRYIKKCRGCCRKYTKEEIDEILDEESEKTETKKKKKDLTSCKACHGKLVKNVADIYNRHRWFGYMNSERTIIDYLVLVVIDEYDDGSYEFCIPTLGFVIEGNDFTAMRLDADDRIKQFLRDVYTAGPYDAENSFITIAYCKETEGIRRNVKPWF